MAIISEDGEILSKGLDTTAPEGSQVPVQLQAPEESNIPDPSSPDYLKQGVEFFTKSLYQDVPFSAAFSESPIGRLTRYASSFMVDSGDEVDDPNFKWTDHIGGYEKYGESFIDAKNFEDINRIKYRIDTQNSALDEIARSSDVGRVASMLAAGIIDPTYAVPLVKGLSAASTAGRVLKGVGQASAIGAATEVARQSILQSTDENNRQSIGESAVDVLTTTAISGLLGGVAGSLAVEVKKGAFTLKNAFKGEDIPLVIKENGDLSIDPAYMSKFKESDLEGLVGINEEFVRLYSSAGFDSLLPASTRGLTSTFNTPKRLINQLFDHNFIVGKELLGESRGEIASLQISKDNKILTDEVLGMRNAYLEYSGLNRVQAVFKKTPEGKLSFPQFQEKVAIALSSLDSASDIPQVAKIAGTIRNGYKQRLELLQELGLISNKLPKSFIDTYQPQRWNTEYLITKEGKDRFFSKFTERFKYFDREGNLHISPRDRSDEDIFEDVQDLYDSIMSQGDDFMDLNSMSEAQVSGKEFTKSRIINVPREDYKEFFDNNAIDIYRDYTFKASALIRTHQAMKQMGFNTVSDMKKALKVDKDELLNQAKTDQERLKIETAFKEELPLIDAYYRASTRTLAVPFGQSKWLGRLLDYQFMTHLGGVSPNSLSEVAMAPFRFGLLNAFKDSYLPMIRDFKAARMSQAEWRDIHVAMDMSSDDVLRVLSDPAPRIGSQKTKLDKGISVATTGFAHATGLTLQTSVIRRTSAQIASAGLSRLIKKTATSKSISKSDLVQLTNLYGVSLKDAPRVAKMLDQYAEELRGSLISNFSKWSDKEAARIFERGVSKAVEATNIIPTAGDIPLAVQKYPLLKPIFQFKSFISAATGRIGASSLQRRDAKTFLGMLYLIGMGTVSQIASDKIANRDTTDDPIRLAFQGLSRSGALGLMGNSVLDTALIMTNDNLSWLTEDSVKTQLTGPAVSTVGGIADVIKRTKDGDISDTDVKSIMKLIPFANLWYLRVLSRKLFDVEY